MNASMRRLLVTLAWKPWKPCFRRPSGHLDRAAAQQGRHINVHSRSLAPTTARRPGAHLERSRRFLKPRIESESARTAQLRQQLGRSCATIALSFELFADYNPPRRGARSLRSASSRSAKTPPNCPRGLRVDPASPRHARGPTPGRRSCSIPRCQEGAAMSTTLPPQRGASVSPQRSHGMGWLRSALRAGVVWPSVSAGWAVMDSHSAEVLAGKQMQLRLWKFKPPLRAWITRGEPASN